MKRVLMLLWIMLLIPGVLPIMVTAQEDPNIIPPSPEAAAFTKYGDIPVSTYTGIPNISIPIYEVRERDISVPISLSYHASGIRVAEEASRVGLGFVINASGLISRTIVGEDDLIGSPFSYHNKNAPDLPLGFINTPTPYIQGDCNLFFNGDTITMDSIFLQTDPYDFEPDQYNFNFPGHSGKFILKPDREVVLEKQEKIQITCLDAAGNAWQIITADGMKYIFDIYEAYRDNTPFSPHKSSWYLTKIESPTGSVVNFNYERLAAIYVKPIGTFIERNYDAKIVLGGGDPCSGPDDPGRMPVRETVPGKEYENVRLSSIDFSTGRVDFIYGPREDLEGDSRLDTIRVYKKDPVGNVASNPFKEFLFGYDYFISSTADADFNENRIPYINKRLKLLSLTEKGIDNGITAFKAPYLFHYYEGGNFFTLPAKTSFARDHWGYFNGKLSNTSLIPSHQTFNSDNIVDFYLGLMGQERDTDPQYSQAFSLKEIEYPTGGKTTFQYESNDIDPELSKTRDESFFAQKPIFYEEKPITLFYDGQNKGAIYQDTLDLSDELVDEHGSFTQTVLQAAFRVANSCTDIVGNPDVYFELYDTAGIRISRVDLGLPACGDITEQTCIYCDPGGSSPVFNYTNQYSLAPGKYVWKAFISGGSDGIPFQDISATYTYIAGINPGGNNVKFVPVGGLRVKKIIDYDDLNSANNRVKTFDYHYKEDRDNDGVEEEYSHGLLMAQPRYSYFEDEKTEKSDGAVTIICDYTHLVRSSDSSIPLNGSASGSIVGYSQVNVMEGQGGINGLTSFTYENKPDKVLNYSTWSLPLGRIAPRRPPSMPNLSYERNGLLLNETLFRKEGIAFVKVSETINEYVSTINNNNVYFAIEKRPPLQNLNPCQQLYLYPAKQSHHIFLSSATRRTYDQALPDNFAETRTDFHYDNPEHLQLTREIVTDSEGQIKTTKYKYPPDYDPAAISLALDTMIRRHIVSSPIEQIQSVNGQVTTAIGTQYKYDSTIDLVLPGNIYMYETSQPGLGYAESANGSDFSASRKRATYHRYDNKGNLQEYSKEGDVHTVYIWGYNQTLPVAQIIGSDFETVKTALGGDAGLANIQSLDGQNLRNALDVLRLDNSLAGAHVTTFTYDPLSGMTSQTDPSGITVFYQYDELNRLKLIKDHEDNILQHFEYHYKNQ